MVRRNERSDVHPEGSNNRGAIKARVVKGAFDEDRERSPVLAERSPAVALDGPGYGQASSQWIPRGPTGPKREPHPLFGLGGSLTLLPQASLTLALDGGRLLTAGVNGQTQRAKARSSSRARATEELMRIIAPAVVVTDA